MSKYIFIVISCLSLAGLISCGLTEDLKISEQDETVILENKWLKFEFDLKQGLYNISNSEKSDIVISQANLRINNWSSDLESQIRTWEKRLIENEFGEGLALDLKITAQNQPDLLFTVIMYASQSFIDISAGVHNSLDSPIQIKDIYVLENGELYNEKDKSQDFAMIDGFSGGEPLEYGKRMYSPLSRRNALKSRNNILLTFIEEEERNTLIMGGLTYKDFEKFATIEQAREVELEKGKDDQKSLLTYLNLPVDTLDSSDNNEVMTLLQGEKMRKWQYHEFYCSEAATTAVDENEIVVELKNLSPNKKYTLGFSWWRSLWHGNRKDHFQSVFVEYEKDKQRERVPLFENQILPLFDGVKKDGIQQVEINLPEEAVMAGKANIVVRHADWTKLKKHQMSEGQTGRVDQNVYLSEIWLRDGAYQSLLPEKLLEIDNCPRPRREFKAKLYANDPVGKLLDPGQTYLSLDRFYINTTTSDPFKGLEDYGISVREAQAIELSMYDFPTVCLWYAEQGGYGGGSAENTTLGAVNEMKIIKNMGFLNYSRAAVRLVPDSYLPVNQQGWWNDEHWQMEDTDRDGSQNGRYIKPYETSEKWGKAITDLGGVPLTYFQAGFRSEDYAKALPQHMLFNKSYAWRGAQQDTLSDLFTTWNKTWSRNRIVWGYDYTDPDFLTHLEEVYENLASGGIKGLMFDYPGYAWAHGGGMEDKYSTTAAAYRNIFRMPFEGFGPEPYVHERNMERGTDVSIGYVASMRTENDTDRMDATTVTRCGLRWYKNRVLYNQDTDSKNIARLQDNRDFVRAVLTMSYVTTGRLLLANSFAQFTAETFWDITRTFPYHTENQSARPVDAFVSDIPRVYDYKVNEKWHQVTFYNSDFEEEKEIGITIAGDPVDGALNLKADKNYLVYDFWNEIFCGVMNGNSRIEQVLRPGEARMLSVREQLDRPQVISTNRHIMQGYLDMENVKWDPKKRELSGTSQVIGNDPYIIVVANNGHKPTSEKIENENDEISKLVLKRSKNEKVNWSVSYN
ncbi:MAG: hypothetical protein HOC82_06685 [Bacteroidetes bacterium]|nr:hypothetical protein [Bacteroidota bacterium]